MKRKIHSLNLVLLAMIFSLSVGCAKKLGDAKMSSDIQSKYSQDSGLASKQLTVQANNGVVTTRTKVTGIHGRHCAHHVVIVNVSDIREPVSAMQRCNAAKSIVVNYGDVRDVDHTEERRVGKECR